VLEPQALVTGALGHQPLVPAALALRYSTVVLGQSPSTTEGVALWATPKDGSLVLSPRAEYTVALYTLAIGLVCTTLQYSGAGQSPSTTEGVALWATPKDGSLVLSP